MGRLRTSERGEETIAGERGEEDSESVALYAGGERRWALDRH